MAFNKSTKETNTQEKAAFNVVENLGLYCYDADETKSGYRLKCTFTAKKSKESKEYTAPIYITVFVASHLINTDPVKQRISVSGSISVNGYTTKSGGERAELVIFAKSEVQVKSNN